MSDQPTPARGGNADSGAGAARLFACPGCGKQYRWSAQLAGKKIRCKQCDHTFWPDSDPNETYTAAVTAAAARSGFAMLAVPARSRVATEAEELTVVNNWVIPLFTLAAGLGWRLFQSFEHAGRFDSVALWESILLVLAEWLVVSLALAGGLLAVAMFVDIELDKLALAALKVISAAILMCAIAQFSSSFDTKPGDLYGMTLGVPCVLLLAFFMLAAMFRADLIEALMGSAVLMICAVGVMAALAFMMQTELGTVLSFGRPA